MIKIILRFVLSGILFFSLTGCSFEFSSTGYLSTNSQNIQFTNIKSGNLIHEDNVHAYNVEGSCNKDTNQVSITITDSQQNQVSAKTPCHLLNWKINGLNLSELQDGPVRILASESNQESSGTATEISLIKSHQAKNQITAMPPKLEYLSVKNGNQNSLNYNTPFFDENDIMFIEFDIRSKKELAIKPLHIYYSLSISNPNWVLLVNNDSAGTRGLDAYSWPGKINHIKSPSNGLFYLKFVITDTDGNYSEQILAGLNSNRPITFGALAATYSALGIKGHNLYVSPRGSGTDCLISNPCSLESSIIKARDLTTSMAENLNIILLGGTYYLQNTIHLTSADSGHNGYSVNYMAYPGESPIISGGMPILNWSMHNSGLNIFKASLPSSFKTRQLYVNGKRAQRTKLVFSNSVGSNSASLAGPIKATKMGYAVNYPEIQSWTNLNSAEVISHVQWRHYRCLISSIVPSAGTVINTSSGSGFNTDLQLFAQDTGLGQTHIGDFNGDGKLDILFNQYSLANAAESHLLLSSAKDYLKQKISTVFSPDFQVGDFNGDGKSDLLLAVKDISTLTINIYLSNGSGFDNPAVWHFTSNLNQKVFAGDFNGDGKSDLLLGYYDETNTWRNSVGLSNGTAFIQPSIWSSNQGSGTKYSIGDFNGDGRSDVLMAYKAGSTWQNVVAISTGTALNSVQVWNTGNGETSKYLIGDFNGDGKSDILFSNSDTTENTSNTVALSSGSSFLAPLAWGANKSGSQNINVGDFNGDGKSDFMSSSDQVVQIQEPCWSIANDSASVPMKFGFNSIENLFEQLRNPGEWYHDTASNIIYYKPRQSENMQSANVIVGYLEKMIFANSAHDVNFFGLTFTNGTWLYPSTNNGYIELQTGHHYTALKVTATIESNLMFKSSKDIKFMNNKVLNMGANALSFAGGSQNIQIVGNKFEQLSAGALMLGDVNDSLQSNTALMNSNIKVLNNSFSNIGLEYDSNSAVFGGYLRNTEVSHNEFSKINYSAITLGWGWSSDPTYAQNNLISHNKISDVMRTLKDGGGIYTLGSQPNSEAKYNHIHGVGNYLNCAVGTQFTGYIGLYHDAGSQYYTDTGNVIQNVCGHWLLLQMNLNPTKQNSWNNTLIQNYVDYDRTWCDSKAGTSATCQGLFGNQVTDTISFGTERGPTEKSIIKSSGIEDSYSYAK